MINRVGLKTPRPFRDIANYEEKAKKIGYRGGERELFKTMEKRLKNESDEVKTELMYLEVFKAVKTMADSNNSVTHDVF